MNPIFTPQKFKRPDPDLIACNLGNINFEEQYKAPTLAEQLREVALRKIAEENDELLNKIHSILIKKAEEGYLRHECEISHKLIHQNGFFEFLKLEIGEGMKIEIEDETATHTIVVFNWGEE